MAVCVLSKAFRRLNIFRKDFASFKNYSTQQSELSSNNVSPTLLYINNVSPPAAKNLKVTYGVQAINFNFGIPRNELPYRKIIENPMISHIQIDEPVKNNIEKSDIMPEKVIEVPTNTNIIEKRAERMIVIRRKKMKKHKRRKFLKRMKFVIRKREHKKQQMKEKKFQAELQTIRTEAENFDAKQYVAERIHLLTKERLPNKWKGFRAPEAMIREFMKEAEEKRAHRFRLRTYRIKLD